ncbi:MAG TPA: response regulator transcription factor [Arachidicoccus sp.]
MRCLLLDDELPGLKYLRMMCEQIPDVEIVKAFDNPSKFLSESQKLDYDFCIIDIEMPEMNGLQIAELMKSKPIIFVTAYKEYAAEAFDLDAVDYIRKPIQRERLEKAIKKVKERLQSDDAKDFIQWNTTKGKTLIFIDKLLLIKVSESDARDKTALLENGEEITLKNISFEYLAKLLPGKLFCRVNKKTMLALKTVSHYSHDEITTQILDDHAQPLQITLSEAYTREFSEKVSR